MKSINRFNVTGNLTRDPELRALQSGTPILSFGLAFNDSKKAEDGSWVDVPNFIDCIIFGNRANSLADLLKKGSKVALEGKLRSSQWQDKETGKNRSKIEVVVEELVLMSYQKAQEDVGF